jgi:hypothetical protein
MDTREEVSRWRDDWRWFKFCICNFFLGILSGPITGTPRSTSHPVGVFPWLLLFRFREGW